MKKIFFASILSSTFAFGWSLSGQVVTEQGVPLSNVNINAFNYSGVSATSDIAGNFVITNEESSIGTTQTSSMNVLYDGKSATFQNVNALLLKISLMDALGKVIYQNEFRNVYGSIFLNFNNLPQKRNFLRVTTDGTTTVYSLGKKSILKKVGDELANLFFTKAGYEAAHYQMQSEIETGVIITMKVQSELQISSSSQNIQSSSSFNSSSSSSTFVQPVTSCTGKTLKSNTSITVNGRKVIVKFPNGYDGTKPAPLLVNYHPIFGSADQWASNSKIANEALNDNAIVVFPDGAQSPNFGKAWNVGPCCTDADDVTFTKNFIKELEDKSCIDPQRIYAAGFSMGGGMSNFVGCRMANIFAAAAPSAFDLAKEVVDGNGFEKCSPERPFPILNFRGTNDYTVNYNGGLSSIVSGKPITFMGAKNNFAQWAKMDGCTDSPVNKGNGCEYYENCKDGVKVGLCTITNGGHSEGDGKTGWDFLKQFKLQ